MEWLAWITTAFSSLAAIFAWIAKIRWSEEYTKAKEETIRSKQTIIELKDQVISGKDSYIAQLEQQIAFLKDFTPPKLWEAYESLKKMFEDYIENLNDQLSEAQNVINNNLLEIEKMKEKGSEGDKKIEELEQKNFKLESLSLNLQQQISEINREKLSAGNYGYFGVTPGTIESTSASAVELSHELGVASVYTVTMSEELLANLEEYKPIEFSRFHGSKNLNKSDDTEK